MLRTKLVRGFLATLLTLAGCAGEAEDPSLKTPDGATEEGKEDRWNFANDPARFDGDLNYHVTDLPLEGRAERDSWPSTYWPTYEDSINTRWNGREMSPAEKYDLAFNGWTPPEGFDALRPFDRNRPAPTDWDQAYYDQLGPLARHISTNMGNRRDREAAIADTEDHRPDEWPVETWWGLCHAWVPAALLEDRPLRAVEHNGVTFEVGDMEALLIAAYNRAPADMIGGRCNLGSGDTQIERDEQGRAIAVECRDSNPGALHVIVTNFLGLQRKGFAFDRTYDYEVWNQPVVGYEITKQEEITVARANELLGLTGDTYTFNADAAKLYEINLAVNWITESHAGVTPNESSRYTRTDRYTYILEVDAEGKIIGGEYTGRSRTQHPDFLWNPRRLTRSSISSLDLDRVRMLVAMSRMPVQPPVATGSEVVATGAGVEIPDNQPAGVTSVATVSGAAGAVVGVRVQLDVTHPYVGDLALTLRHGNVERTFRNRTGGSADDIRETVDVAGFEGLDPNGEWTLVAADTARSDVGRVNSWSVTVVTDSAEMPTEPTTPTTGAQRFAGQGGVAIPDDEPNGITSTASVTGLTHGAVAIEVDIAHTYRGDLRVAVEHGGRTWTLQDQEGGNADDLVQTFALDATGDAFSGDPSGTWTLHVSDHAGADVGTLRSWAVVVTP
ncbi:MAG: proprotein convertase P-domain-containing protein [Sandaracinus sp.]|nr:proprotein convertase P-domain-containing protein [Sandaracinus sp.]